MVSTIRNPKRSFDNKVSENWFPYYAGFSGTFVHDLLSNSDLSEDACVLDPWNGSGTTTTAAHRMGVTAIGFDLNPVMVIAAKASLLNRMDYSSILPLTSVIVDISVRDVAEMEEDDALTAWFSKMNARNFRCLERAVQQSLISSNICRPVIGAEEVTSMSSVAAFFYVALFRTVRWFVNSFTTSNPTWIKLPKGDSSKLRPSSENIYKRFRSEVGSMLSLLKDQPFTSSGANETFLTVGTSTKLRVKEEIADIVITSPPYCTRIDYAVATLPELTVLGYRPEREWQDLRRSLIGTSTVNSNTNVNDSWGATCLELLNRVESHSSKASKSYYVKNHIQYFDGIYQSVSELSRCMKSKARAYVVVQDSFYKDLRIDLATIFSEMSAKHNLILNRQENFSSGRNMAGINSKSKAYRSSSPATESVLCFTKK